MKANKIFSSDGLFYTVTEKIFDLFVISIFWLVGCIPVITIGTSCSAMYNTIVNVIRNNTSNVTLEFWKTYKRDFKSSLPISLIFSAILFILLLNFGIVRQINTSLFGLFLLVMYMFLVLLVITSVCYAFCLLSRFNMSFKWIIKMSFYMTFRYLPSSVIILALFLISYFLMLIQPYFFFIVPALATLATSFITEPILNRHIKEDLNNEIH